MTSDASNRQLSIRRLAGGEDNEISFQVQPQHFPGFQEAVLVRIAAGLREDDMRVHRAAIIEG